MIPENDDETDYDHPDFVMPWRQIVGTAVYGPLAAVIVAAVLVPAALFSRPRREDALRLDPAEAAQVREARERRT